MRVFGDQNKQIIINVEDSDINISPDGIVVTDAKIEFYSEGEIDEGNPVNYVKNISFSLEIFTYNLATGKIRLKILNLQCLDICENTFKQALRSGVNTVFTFLAKMFTNFFEVPAKQFDLGYGLDMGLIQFELNEGYITAKAKLVLNRAENKAIQERRRRLLAV